MQSKNMTAGVSASPHHFSQLANQNAASNQLPNQNAASTTHPLDVAPQKSLSNAGDADKQQQQQQQQLMNLANTKEKTPMCLVNELARYNKVGTGFK